MPEYLDIEDLPGPKGRNRKYPWDEWAAIPEGKMIEVSEHLNGRSPQSFCAGNRNMAKQRGLSLRMRAGRVYILREEQS